VHFIIFYAQNNARHDTTVKLYELESCANIIKDTRQQYPVFCLDRQSNNVSGAEKQILPVDPALE